MKSACLALVLCSLALVLSACSSDPPRVRVTNQRADTTDIQLNRSNGSTYYIDDVGGGVTTGYIDVEPSGYEVVGNVEGVATLATTTFSASEDETYTLVILNTTPPTLRVDTP